MESKQKKTSKKLRALRRELKARALKSSLKVNLLLKYKVADGQNRSLGKRGRMRETKKE